MEPELYVAMDFNVHDPDRGMLTVPAYPLRQAPPLNGEGWKAAANARAWGVFEHLKDTHPQRKPAKKRSRQWLPLPVDAVRELLRGRPHTIAEMAALLATTNWQIRNAMAKIGMGNIQSKPIIKTKGTPIAQFWMAA